MSGGQLQEENKKDGKGKKVLDNRWRMRYHIKVACGEKGFNPLAMVSGSIAQLGEHLPYKQRVTGSSPVVPTNHLAR